MRKLRNFSSAGGIARFARMFICVGLSGFAGTTARPAEIQAVFTGKEMLGYCQNIEQDQQKDFDRGLCIGFLDGFLMGQKVGEHYHAFHHRDEKIDNIFGRLCLPPTITRALLAKTFVRYLERVPDKLNSPAGLLLDEALRDAFPCSDKAPPKSDK